MAKSTTTVTREVAAGVADNDLVPAPWKTLFTNEEWLIHRIVVWTSYGGMAIAIIAHVLVWFWRPWIQIVGG